MPSSALSTGAQERLVAFRLAEVPLDVRVRAADSVARRADMALPDDAGGVKGLLARLGDRAAGHDSADRDSLRRVAREPSDRVYWISLAAWERVMGR